MFNLARHSRFINLSKSSSQTILRLTEFANTLIPLLIFLSGSSYIASTSSAFGLALALLSSSSDPIARTLYR